MDVLATNARISINWNLMLNFFKLKQRIFKPHSSSCWPNVGGWGYWKFYILTSGTQTAVLSNQSSVNLAVETLLTVHQRFFVSSWAIYLPDRFPTPHIHIEIEPFTSCVISLVQYIQAHKNCCNYPKIWIIWLYHRVMSQNQNCLLVTRPNDKSFTRTCDQGVSPL